jgi:NitT/TauT family transport system substrate-binding protein
VLVSGVKFLKRKRDLAAKFVLAHRELTDWILSHPDEAKQMVRQELAAETKADVSPDLIAQAWKRIVLTNDPSIEEYRHFVADAQRAGFIRSAPDLSRLIERVN